MPLSATHWENVAAAHLARYPETGRNVGSLKRKFKELYNKRVSIGDPNCPPAVRRAKRLKQGIIDLMDGSDLNSDENGDGATDIDGNGDGATDDDDDDGDNSDGAAADDDNDDVDNIEDNNLPPRVGKRNDGCDETKTKEEETVAILWQYTQQSNRSQGGGW